jgi:hypothetical protein
MEQSNHSQEHIIQYISDKDICMRKKSNTFSGNKVNSTKQEYDRDDH